MSGVRRTEDLHTLKTRGLTIQGFNNTFAPAGSVVAAYDSNGHYAPTQDLVVNTVDVSSGLFKEILLASSEPGTQDGILTYTPQGLALNGVPIITSVYATSAFQPLDPNSTSLPTLVASYNQLLSVMAIQQAFVTLPSSVNISFGTVSSGIGLVTFPTSTPSAQTTTSITIPGPVSLPALQVTTQINAACLAANMPLNFYLSPLGVVSVLVATGYSFSVVDPPGQATGTSALFLTKMGLGSVISVTYPSSTVYSYSGNTVGSPLV